MYINNYGQLCQDEYLSHHGILGMHWGVRRYQPYSVVPRGSGKSGKEIGAAKSRVVRGTEAKASKVRAKTDLVKARTEYSAAKKEDRLKNTVSSVNNKTKASVDTTRSFTKSSLAKKPTITKEEYEAAKEKALKSGSATEIMKFKGDLTNQQLNEARNRLDMERQLAEISEAEKHAGRRKVDKFFKDLDTVNSYTKTTLTTYNNAATIANTFGGTDLPTINNKKKK